mgnify:FL=1
MKEKLYSAKILIDSMWIPSSKLGKILAFFNVRVQADNTHGCLITNFNILLNGFKLIDGIKGKFISMPEKYETIEFPGCYPKEKRIDVIELYDGTEQLILKEALKKYDELSKKETI